MANVNAIVTKIDFYSKSLTDVSDVEICFHSSNSVVYWTCKKTMQRYFTLEKTNEFGLICIPKFYGISKIKIITSIYDHKICGTKFVTHSFYLVPTEVEDSTLPTVMNIL